MLERIVKESSLNLQLGLTQTQVYAPEETAEEDPEATQLLSDGELEEWEEDKQWKAREESNQRANADQNLPTILEEEEKATEYSCRVTNNVGKDERRVTTEEADFMLPVVLGITLPLLLLAPSSHRACQPRRIHRRTRR